MIGAFLELAHPAALWAGALVVAGALWALWRPSRQQLAVGSLELWHEALAQLQAVSHSQRRRIDVAWLCLLAGGLLVSAALAGPRILSYGPRRQVVVQLARSARWSDPDDRELFAKQVHFLLDRLDPSDQVRLVGPEQAPLPEAWLSPLQARKAVADLPVIPLRAESLRWPVAGEGQWTYRIVPAGAAIADAEGAVPVGLAFPQRGPHLLSVGAKPTDANAAAPVAVVATAGGQPGAAQISLWSYQSGQGQPTLLSRQTVTVEDRPVQVRWVAPPAQVLMVTLSPSDQSPRWSDPSRSAFLIRRPQTLARVALIGPDEAILRRYVQADGMLTLVADANQADLILARRTPLRSRLPALLIDPPTPPPGWRQGDNLGPLLLSQVDLAVDDPLLKGLDLSGLAIRDARPWLAGDMPQGTAVATAGGQAFIVRSEPAGPQPRRIYLAFDLTPQNVNVMTSEAAILLLARSTRWLVPDVPDSPTGYGALGPDETLVLTAAPAVGGAPGAIQTAPPLAWPGVYVDGADILTVSAVGPYAPAGIAPPRGPVRPTVDPEEASLPEPTAGPATWNPTPWLTLVAAGLWLTGWALRKR